MEIYISNSGAKPIYEQITDQIKAAILAGKLAEGEALPSIRFLAKELGISVITTKRAYEELEKQGLIYSEQGKGFFVSEVNQNRLMEGRLREYERRLRDMLGEARELGLSPEDVADMVRMFWDKGGDPK